MFNALDIPIYYYLISAVIGIAVGCWKKDWISGILASYLFFILAGTVLIRKPGVLRYELIPFWSWKSPEHYNQIIVNILMFIPIGLLLGIKAGWKGILVASGISVGIEIAQLVTRRGLFEFDDIIHNTLGAAVGFGLWMLVRRALKNDV